MTDRTGAVMEGARQVDLGRFLEMEKSTLSCDLKRMEQQLRALLEPPV